MTLVRSRKARQVRRGGQVVRSSPRAATATVRALLVLAGQRLSVAELSRTLGIGTRTTYRTIADLRSVLPVRETREAVPRYWIARVDLDRAIEEAQ